MAKKTWADRAQDEFKLCGSHGWHDLENVFRTAERYYHARDLKRGHIWYNRGVVEVERRLSLSRGEAVRTLSMNEVLSVFDCYGFYPQSVQESDSVTVTKNPKPGPVVTLPLPGIPRRPGRPVTGKALSVAERQARHRQKAREEADKKLSSVVASFDGESDSEVLNWLATGGPKLQEKAWMELGRRKGW